MPLYTRLAIVASLAAAAIHSTVASDDAGDAQKMSETLHTCRLVKTTTNNRLISLPKNNYHGIQFDEMSCGSCVEIKRGGLITYAQLVSNCEDCKSPQLSQKVYDEWNDSKWGHERTEYRYAACPIDFFPSEDIEVCFAKGSTAKNPIIQPIFANQNLISVKANINKNADNFKVNNYVLTGPNDGFFFKQALLSSDDDDNTSLDEMQKHEKHWLHVELAHVSGARAFTSTVKITKKALDNEKCISLNGNFERVAPETPAPTPAPRTDTPSPTPAPGTDTPSPTPAPGTDTPSPTPAPASGAAAVATMTIATVMVTTLVSFVMMM